MRTYRRKFVFIMASVVIAIMALLTIFSVLMITEVIRPHETTLVIQVKSVEKEYDGEEYVPTSDDGYNIVKGKLEKGHTIDVAYSRGMAEAGVSTITLIPFISDSNGADVTDSYDIDVIPGEYVVKPKVVTLTVDEMYAEKHYDKTPLKNDEVYFEDELIEGHELVIGEEIAEITEIGTIDNQVEIDIVDADGKSVLKNYSVQYKLGTLTILPNVLTLRSSSHSAEYTIGIDVRNDIVSCDSEGVETLKELNHDITYNVTGSQTEIGVSDNTFEAVVTMIDENGNEVDVTDMYVINKEYGKLEVTPVEIEIKARDCEKEYDGTPLSCTATHPNSDCVYEKSTQKLLPGHVIEGECQGTQTEIGTGENRPNNVVIYDGDGNDVSGLYAITYASGKLTVTGKPISISGQVLYLTYNAQPQSYADAQDETPLDEYAFISVGELFEGHEIVTNVSEPEVTHVEAGEYQYSISATVIESATGDDVSNLYNIRVQQNAKLVISQREVIIQTDGRSWAYTGNEYSTENDGSDWWEVTNNLVDGHYFDNDVIGKITYVGKVKNDIVVRVLDQNGNNVTQNYRITKHLGELEVFEERLVIYASTSSGTATYDGTPKSIDSSTVDIVDDSNLVEGHWIDYDYGFRTISEIDAGRHDNVVLSAEDGGFKVYDQNGVDVSQRYEIGYLDQDVHLGKLTIYPRKLPIITNNYSKPYDGNPLTGGTEYTLGNTASILLPGHTIVGVNITGSQTNVGTSKNTVEIEVQDGSGNDVSQNYTADDAILGTLEVTKRQIYIALYDNQVVYVDDFGQIVGVDNGVNSEDKLLYSIVSGYECIDGHELAMVEFEIDTSVVYADVSVDSASDFVVVDSATGRDVSQFYELIVLENFVIIMQ